MTADPGSSPTTRRNPRQPNKTQAPECPTCGHAYSTQIDNGWANMGSVPLRQYTCPNDCPTFVSGEFVLPIQATKHVAAYDERRREQRRLHARKMQGYWATPPRGGAYLRSATITATITVHPEKRKGYPRRQPMTSTTSDVEELAS
jgi:hypothetical protein